MTEPDQIQCSEDLEGSRARTDARSIPVRVGVIAGSALLIVVGAVAAMGSRRRDGPPRAGGAASE